MHSSKTTGAVSTAPDLNAPAPLGRREFLERAALSAAALLVIPDAVQSAGGVAGSHFKRAQHAVFDSLAPGAVLPAGWLRLYLQKQARQLGSHLPEVSWPFTGRYWSGEETPPDTAGIGWWPWEQMAYWVDGALRCALTLKDAQLMQAALTPVRYTLERAQPDGYLGPIFARDAKEPNPAYDNFRWPHTVFFRALAAYSDATDDARVPLAVRRHYLSDRNTTRYGGPSRDVTNVESMLWAYERTGDRQLLDMAEKAWNDFLVSAAPGDLESGDLHPDRIFANTPIHAHGVTYIEKAKLPAILYLHTGKAEYLRFALAAQDRIFNHHMLIDGIPSTSENYRDTTALDTHETCDISDHTWTWGYLLMATGDAVWADRIERACFNAGLGAIRKDWKGVQYFSCPNQVIATHDSSHTPLPLWEENPGSMAYRPNPGHESACCGANVHRLFPNYVIRMWMTDSEGGLAAILYGASTVRAKAGRERHEVEIRQDTDYPFGEEIHFTVRSDKAITFPLSLRIPGWCKAPRLELNGQSVTAPINKGFLRLIRTFQPGDRITLTLPMHAALTYWSGNGVGFEHGPLVYSLAIKEDWSPVVVPKWSTAEYPEWDARPRSAWNYAIGVDEARTLSEARIERTSMTEDPWIDPPVMLTVPMKSVPGWGLREDPKHPERKQTPPLPEIDQELYYALKKAPVERVGLVPYGVTQLRLTIFPQGVTADE